MTARARTRPAWRCAGIALAMAAASSSSARPIDFDGVRRAFAAMGGTILLPARSEAFVLSLARPYLEIHRSVSARATFDLPRGEEVEFWLPPEQRASGAIGRVMGPIEERSLPPASRLFAPGAAKGRRGTWRRLFRGHLAAGRYEVLFENEKALSVLVLPVSLREEILAGLAGRRLAVWCAPGARPVSVGIARPGRYVARAHIMVRQVTRSVEVTLEDCIRAALEHDDRYRIVPADGGGVAFCAVPPDHPSPAETPGSAPPIAVRLPMPVGIEASDRLRLLWTSGAGDTLASLAAVDLDGDGAADIVICPKGRAADFLEDTYLLRRRFTFEEILRWSLKRRHVREEIIHRDGTAVITFPRRGDVRHRQELELRLATQYELAEYPFVSLAGAVERPDRQQIEVVLDVDADRDGRAERSIRARVEAGELGRAAPSRLDMLEASRDGEARLAGGRVLGLRVVLRRTPGTEGRSARRFELAAIGVIRRDLAVPVPRDFAAARVVLGQVKAEPEGIFTRCELHVGEAVERERPDPKGAPPGLLGMLLIPGIRSDAGQITVRSLALEHERGERTGLAGWPISFAAGGEGGTGGVYSVEAGSPALVDRFALAARRRPISSSSAPPPLVLLGGGAAEASMPGEGPGGSRVSPIAAWRIEEDDASVLVHEWHTGVAITSRAVRPHPSQARVHIPVFVDLRAYPRLEVRLRYAWRAGPPVRLVFLVALDPDPSSSSSRAVRDEVSLDRFADPPSTSPVTLPLLDRIEARYPFAPAYRLREIVIVAPEGDYDLHLLDLRFRPAASVPRSWERFGLRDWSVRAATGRVLVEGGGGAWLTWLPGASFEGPEAGGRIFSLARPLGGIPVARAARLYLDAALPEGSSAGLRARIAAVGGPDGASFERVLRDPGRRWIDLRKLLGSGARLSSLTLELVWKGRPRAGILPAIGLKGLFLARGGPASLSSFLEDAWDEEPEIAWEARFWTEADASRWEWSTAGAEMWRRVERGGLRVGARFDEQHRGKVHVRLRRRTSRIDLRRFPFLWIEGTADAPLAGWLDLELYLDRGDHERGRSVRFHLPPGLPVLDLAPVVSAVFPDLEPEEVPVLSGIAICLGEGDRPAAQPARSNLRSLQLRRVAVFGPRMRKRPLGESLADVPLLRIDDRVIRAREIPGLGEALEASASHVFSGPAMELAAGDHIVEAMPHPLLAAPSLLLWPEESEARAPEVAWRRVNATRYVAHVRSERPFLLVLNELFHPDWRAYVRDVPRRGAESPSALLSAFRDRSIAHAIPVGDHWVANGYANGFLLRRTGSYEVVVEFFPQRYLEAGLALTGGLVVFLVALSIVRIRRRRLARSRGSEPPIAPPEATGRATGRQGSRVEEPSPDLEVTR